MIMDGGNRYRRQISRIFEKQDLPDGGAVVRVYTALVCKGSLGRRDILNKLRLCRWINAVPG